MLIQDTDRAFVMGYLQAHVDSLGEGAPIETWVENRLGDIDFHFTTDGNGDFVVVAYPCKNGTTDTTKGEVVYKEGL
jgi:hypothetical protein